MSFEFLNQLPTPADIKRDYPLSPELRELKKHRDLMISDVITGKDSRVLVIIGPCSADNEDSVCDYVSRLTKIQEDDKQAYTGLYTFSDGQMQTLLPQCAVGIDEITAKINESGKKTVFLGDGVPAFADYLKENLQVPYLFAPAHCNKQRAACVAVLGGILYRQGKAEDAAAHKPDYLRLSQAERERQEKARDFRI